MGTYINIGNAGFQSVRNGEYVDKSGLIALVNSTLFTERRYSCVTRSRRFGKSLAAKMLSAYYDRSVDSRALFAGLQIARAPSFEKHLNKYPVIYLDLSDFTERFKNDSIVDKIKEKLRVDILEAYPEVRVKEDDDLMEVLLRINDATGDTFILVQKCQRRPRLRRCLYDGHPACQEIQDRVGTEQFHRVVGINYDRETKTHSCRIE